MRLQDLTAQQARECGNVYLQRLITLGIEYMTPTQCKISEGLSAYCWVKQAEYVLANYSSDFVLKSAVKELEHWKPVVIECESFVDQWLAEGQPLDIEVE